MWKSFAAVALIGVALSGGLSVAQRSQGTDPIFWCDISRSQVSHERDAALATIEVLKARNAALDARVKELEARPKEPPKKDEPQ